MAARRLRLYVNIDHIATLRQARRSDEPDPVEAAAICERAGADGITAHLREDRRHIQDSDVERLATSVRTYFNLETACVPEMIAIAVRLKPQQVTLVPERREEVTTEGGLAVTARPAAVQESIAKLSAVGIRTSLFIDSDIEAVRASRDLGADAIELHTGEYSRARETSAAVDAIRKASRLGRELGLAVHAGHGLTVRNVGPVASIMDIEELNIGHSIVSRAVMVGLDTAVREIREAMDAARGSVRGAA
jgi:pyridoxine 5-phosphate synthase